MHKNTEENTPKTGYKKHTLVKTIKSKWKDHLNKTKIKYAWFIQARNLKVKTGRDKKIIELLNPNKNHFADTIHGSS